jgi:6,7-dimethyl-8-ribityllumazine synthase
MASGRVDIVPVAAAEVRRVAIVWSRYNEFVTRGLLEGAVAEFRRRVGSEDGLVVMEASGSFEVPVLVQRAATSGRFDAVVALGCIIKGETSHDQHLATAVTNALLATARETGVPVGLGVLTVDSAAQAEARAGGLKGNKGVEAMAAALETAGTLAALGKLSGVHRPKGQY